MTRVTRRSGFTAVPNDAMRDERLSIEARGLLALMMGMGDAWIFRSSDLSRRCGVGRDKYQRMIRELKETGYLEVVPAQGEGGKLDGYDYVLHDDAGGLKNRLPVEPPAGKQSHLRKPNNKNTNSKNTPKPPEGDLFSASSKQEQASPEVDDIEQGFEEFWNDIWPSHIRKKAKKDCQKVYAEACTGKHRKADRVSPQQLNKAARAYIASVTDRQFLKGTLPWLREPGWEPFLDVQGDHRTTKPLSRYQQIIQENRHFAAGAVQ